MGCACAGPSRRLFPSYGASDVVLFDGQGLGHVAEVSPSISTNVTHRFPDVDLILLVDSAQQPMQAAPITLLKAVASAGHGDRLAIAFTHFDQVRGDNLQTFSQKRSHVLAAVTNALAFLRQNVPAGVVDLLREALDSRCFLLGGLDGPIAEVPSGILQQFQRLGSHATAVGDQGDKWIGSYLRVHGLRARGSRRRRGFHEALGSTIGVHLSGWDLKGTLGKLKP